MALVAGLVIVGLVAVLLVVTRSADSEVSVSNGQVGLTVKVPSGALDGEVSITRAEPGAVTFDALSAPIGGKVARIEVKDGTLDGEAVLTFDIPPGADPKNTYVYTYDRERKQPVLVGGTVDENARTITVVTGHFSEWWTSEFDLKKAVGDGLRNTFSARSVKGLVHDAPDLTCLPALTVTTTTNTLPKGVDPCVTYNDSGELLLSVGNELGAPLAFSPGRGVRLRSIEPANETVYNGLVAFLREELDDDTVVIGSGRRATFTVNPGALSNHQINLTAKIDVGHAAFAFSGALSESILPFLKITKGAKGYRAAQAAFAKADKAAKYTECILSSAQQIGKITDPKKARLAYIESYNKCQGNLAHLLTQWFKNPVGMAISAGEQRTLKNAINRLPEAVAKQTTKLLTAFLNAGDLAQPLTTAIAAARHGTGPFQWRLTLNDEPPLTRLGQVLPKPPEGNYIVDGTLAKSREQGLRQGFQSLPELLLPCQGAWSTTWMAPLFAGGGYELVPPSAGKRIHADVHITYVQPQQRANVAAYLKSWSGRTSCNGEVPRYSVTYKYKGEKVASTFADDSTIAWSHWFGVPNSDDIHSSHQMVAFSQASGYLMVVSIVPGERGAFFAEKVPPAEMAAALDAAYKLASSKANQMLGARLNRN
ncbi:hypothetical protein [Actinomadura meridiana]|uniref:hypothetical protein n=1 Tax=Actinomadura meridiana TaxID=559626 RepID=UPI0031E9E604